MPCAPAGGQGLNLGLGNFSGFSSLNFPVRLTDGDGLDAADTV